MAEQTTIKVPVDLRDEIKVIAQQRGESMPSIIEEMLELYREEIRMRRLESQVRETTPEQMESYIAETAEWDMAYGW
ncbi:ribbon-helix-helix protein, CopG family [Corynebacterium sp. p3-SID1194]|uniref:ribbon-helix-helix protein, CopG family n=1 Tax=Corynebacterium sp. p3-SID1194 TaxID=2916105 RepID=UPI0021A4AD80|nr:ribbon-helix-helix protein, CopG family [Corynebacterium sp. p3-SID1194]MCT1450181.1 ribbon-helix-helix protein, CopG family [Corynebacterium sp. p3-SID1194]